MKRILSVVVFLAAILLLGVAGADGPEPRAVVVLDPGHGGADFGARGVAGLQEKDVALSVARRIGDALVRRGVQVVYTRDADEFVTLAERTSIANRARADLFLSIHANSATNDKVNGFETYFLSLQASDDEAMRVAMTENDVYKQKDATADSVDIVGSILGDLIRTEHLRGSSQVANAIQHNLAPLPGASRGVKQAPFVVLMGVNMPAALIEIGFLSHAEDEQRLKQSKHQRAIAHAIAAAVDQTLSARRAEPPAQAPASVEAGE